MDTGGRNDAHRKNNTFQNQETPALAPGSFFGAARHG
jgi:hypothetical protein